MEVSIEQSWKIKESVVQLWCSMAILDCRRVWEWSSYATKIRVQPSNWGGSGEHFRCNWSQPPQPPQLDLFSRRSKSQIYSDRIQSRPIIPIYSNQISSNQFNSIHSKSFNLINSSISPILTQQGHWLGAFFSTSLRTTRGRSSTWGPEDGETWRCMTLPDGSCWFITSWILQFNHVQPTLRWINQLYNYQD